MALITIDLERDGTFAPRALSLLEPIPQNALFNAAHQLRHPASIYRLSLEKIAAAFCLVAEEYLAKTEQNREYSSASLEINQLLKYQADFLRILRSIRSGVRISPGAPFQPPFHSVHWPVIR